MRKPWGSHLCEEANYRQLGKDGRRAKGESPAQPRGAKRPAGELKLNM